VRGFHLASFKSQEIPCYSGIPRRALVALSSSRFVSIFVVIKEFIGSEPSKEETRMADKKTAIVTGASRGIGAGLVEAFLNEGYNVVATSRHVSQSLTASTRLVLVDGDIGKSETAAKTVEAAIKHFGTIDVLVNNAGIYRGKPFTEFTTEDFNELVSTNLLGFLYITQLTVKQMLKDKSGSVVTITASSADQPIAGNNGSVSMITKGGLNTVTRSLAIEYAKAGIRFNAVAPGVVDTPMHKDDSKEFLKTLQPMGRMVAVKDIVDAVLYLSQTDQVTGEVLHVDGGAHAGRW
jgi:NAD(P)-dependent dehydrogenase (short-subunit alcohol dehydrogenase family)